MAHSNAARRARITVGTLLLALALSGACVEGTLDPTPNVATLVLLFPGNDSVRVDIESGDVTSGPIGVVSSATFTAEFFASDGTPDMRVTELGFRLDVTPANTGIVTFDRTTPFAGTLNKVSTGTTQITFALIDRASGAALFSCVVPAQVD